MIFIQNNVIARGTASACTHYVTHSIP